MVKKRIVVVVVFIMIGMSALTHAQTEVDFSIIPKSEGLEWDVYDTVTKWWWVWDAYNKKADELELADQINSGIINWDTLLNYIVYLAKFLGQLGLLIATFVLIYIWYDKAMQVYSFSDSKVGMVIKWLIVIIWAYFIVKFLYNAFIS